MTERVSPGFCDVQTWRAVVHNNAPITCVLFVLRTARTWLPHALVDAGFFPSGSEVKRNRADLWRDLADGETVRLGWAEITLRAILPAT